MSNTPKPDDLAMFDDAPEWAKIMYQQLLVISRMNEKPLPVLVGTAEAAQMLDISANTLRLWYQEGKMPPNKGKGKHLKFERTAIIRLVTVRKGRRGKR